MRHRTLTIAALALALVVLNIYLLGIAQNAAALSWKQGYFGLAGWRRTFVEWVDWHGASLHAVALVPSLVVVALSWTRFNMSRTILLAVLASVVFGLFCLAVRQVAFAPF